MTDDEAIDAYNRAGEASARGRRFPPVRWPDLPLDARDIERLAEGVLASRLDLGAEAFGPDFDSVACADRLEDAWRTDACEARFAPEGVYMRAAFTVAVALRDEDTDSGAPGATPEIVAKEALTIVSEICLSFVERHHTRPFVDFMGGEIRRAGDGATRRLDPCAFMIEPADAVAWGLNGAAPPGG
jgi:hypothetical protein